MGKKKTTDNKTKKVKDGVKPRFEPAVRAETKRFSDEGTFLNIFKAVTERDGELLETFNLPITMINAVIYRDKDTKELVVKYDNEETVNE